MRKLGSLCGVVLLSGWVGAQGPTPPKPLPPSITGERVVPAPVRATGAAVPLQTPQAPIQRFLDNLAKFPPETVQAVYGFRAGADWLWRMNQPNGRFFYGLSPAVRRALDTDHDLHQALAAWALAESARFTADDRLTARATQTVLALLAQVRQEPITASDKAQRTGLIAGLILAIYALPEADDKLMSAADGLIGQLRQRFDSNGIFLVVNEGIPAETLAGAMVPGLVLQAIVQSDRFQPEAWKKELVIRSASNYHKALKAQPNALLTGSLLPALVDVAMASNKDADLCGMVFDLADQLCARQYGQGMPPPVGWLGGFPLHPTSPSEPTAESACLLSGLIAAMKLTRQVPDATRYAMYRNRIVDGLSFCRNLQYSDENADHFEKSFRSRFLVGGAHLSPSDGIVRVDATAQVVLAYQKFLSSGGETRD